MSNINKVLETLKSKGLIKGKQPHLSTLKNYSAVQIVDLGRRLFGELDSGAHFSNQQHHLTHCASLKLSGGTDDCIVPPCRIQSVNQMGRFAALYSDKVYTYNFFSRYEHISTHKRLGLDLYMMQMKFVGDLLVLLELIPLIKKGIAFPVFPMFCKPCYAEMTDFENEKRFHKANRDLLKGFSENTKDRYLRKTKLGFEVEFFGKPPYFDHAGKRFLVTVNLPPKLAKTKRIRSMRTNQKVVLNESALKELGFYERLSNDVIRDIVFELLVTKSSDSAFLTHHPLHINFLRSITNDGELERKNHIAFRFLTSKLPALEGVSISNLIKIREVEGAAFQLFRRAISEAAENFSGQKDFTEQDARALYADQIAPKLAKVEITLQAARRNLIRIPIAETAATVAAVSFGLYSGLLSKEFSALAASIGLIGTVRDTVGQIVKKGSAHSKIRENEMYFLWRVSKLARRN